MADGGDPAAIIVTMGDVPPGNIFFWGNTVERKREFGRSVGNRRKYPWERWFALPRVELKRGVDYDLSQSSMYSSIKNAASVRRVSIKLTDTGDGIIIQRQDAEE